MAEERYHLTEKGALLLEIARAIEKRTGLDSGSCFGVIEEYIDDIYNALERRRLKNELGIREGESV